MRCRCKSSGLKIYKRHLSSNEEVARTFHDKIVSLENNQRRFRYENQHTISITTVPSSAPKSARDLAEAKPWTGEENYIDASRRMLEDSLKPLKVPVKQRLLSAREDALDYSLNEEGATHQDRVVSSQKKRRRFGAGMGGKASSGLSSGGWIESIASQEIENAVARGQFTGISKGIDQSDSRDDLIEASRNPQLDYTGYLLNNIIKKQGGAPPWIMKQIAVRDRINRFREQIRRRLQEKLVHKVAELGKYDLTKSVSLAKESLKKDTDWEAQYAVFHQEAVDDINRQLRGYNLQAPQSARKSYLSVDSEISRCYDTVLDGIEDEIARFVGQHYVPKIDKGGLHSHIPAAEPPEKHYGLRELIKDLFTKSKPTSS